METFMLRRKNNEAEKTDPEVVSSGAVREEAGCSSYHVCEACAARESLNFQLKNCSC